MQPYALNSVGYEIVQWNKHMTQWEEIIYDTLENYYIEMITWELRNYEITNKDTKETRSFFLNQYDFRGTSRMLYLILKSGDPLDCIAY